MDMSSLVDGCVPDEINGRGSFRLIVDDLPLAPDQLFTLRIGARRENMNHMLLPTTDIGTFRIVASAHELGFLPSDEHQGLGSMAPILHPYEWVMPDGDTHRIQPLESYRKSRGRPVGNERADGGLKTDL